MVKCSLTSVVIVEGPPYTGAMWKELSLILMVSEVESLTSVIKGHGPLVVESGEVPPYTGGQWRSATLYWLSMKRMPPYIIGQ